MRRILAMVLLAALATAPTMRPADAQKTASGDRTYAQRDIAVQMRAYPQTIRPGQIGTWVATQTGDWQGGTLSIYVTAQLADPSYFSTPDGITCTTHQSGAAFSLDCDVPPGSVTIALVAQLIISPPLIHSVAAAHDQADTLLAEDWQFTAGTARRYLPLVVR